jgi:titin
MPLSRIQTTLFSGDVEDSTLRTLLISPPTGIIGSAGNGQISVSWTAPDNIIDQSPVSDYVVQYSSNSGSTWTTVSEGTSTNTSTIVSGLTNGVSYIFRVAAITDIATSNYSIVSSPIAPSTVTLNAVYGSVAGSGTLASPWSWQSGSGFSEGTSGKLLTADASVFIKASLTNTGGGNCDGGEERSLGIYSAANTRLRSMSVNITTVMAIGEYVMLELGCAHARADIYIVDGTPTAPTGFSMIAGNSQAALSWTAPSDNGATSITNYSVEYTPTGGSSTTTLLNSTLTSSRLLSGLTNGTTYSVRIAAVNSVGVGAYSSAVSVTPQDGPPVTLHIPYGPVTGSGTVSSKWSWQSGSGFSEGTSAKLVTAEETVFIKATLTQTGGGNCDGGESVSLGIYSAANTRLRTMTAGITATLASGEYVSLELGCAHARADIYVVDGTPAAPTGLSVIAGTSQGALSWTAPTDGGATAISNYSVEYTPTGGTPTTLLFNSTLTSSRVLSSLTNGTTYSVRVAAVNSIGVGTYSSAVSFTPQDGPPVTLHIPYGPVTGSGTVASKWSWQSGSGFSEGTSAKLITADSSVTLQATLSQTGGGNCDGGESLSLGIYSSSNIRIRTMSSNPESLTAGQYIFMELGCAHGRAEVWVV